MKQQTLEEAAKKELISSCAVVGDRGGFTELLYNYNAMLNMFRKGAEWHVKQSPWISVKERLPEEGNPVLIRLKDGVVRLASYDIDEDSNIYFWDDNYAYETFRPWDVTHWREIPSFDEILESNKDVLERIKEKEVNHG